MKLLFTRRINDVEFRVYEPQRPSDIFLGLSDDLYRVFGYFYKKDTCAKLCDSYPSLARNSYNVTIDGEQTRVFNLKGLLLLCKISRRDTAGLVIEKLIDIACKVLDITPEETEIKEVKEDVKEEVKNVKEKETSLYEVFKRRELDLKAAEILQKLADSIYSPQMKKILTKRAIELLNVGVEDMPAELERKTKSAGNPKWFSFDERDEEMEEKTRW